MEKGRIVETRDGFKWYIEGGDDLLVSNDGEYTVRKFLYFVSDKNKVFCDIGAHIGEYAIRMSRYYKFVFAFEPNPRSYNILNKNILLNGTTNVIAYNFALGDFEGSMELVLRGGSSTMVKRGESERRVKVNVKKLDDVLSEVDVIKIDVEGFEERVIRGALELIEKCRPIIVIEHHEYRGYKECIGMRERIAKLLKNYYKINLNGIHWAYIPYEEDIYKYKEFIAYHYLNKCLKNIEEGKPWYFGLPYTWWYGAGPVDFLLALQEHIEEEDYWIKNIK